MCNHSPVAWAVAIIDDSNTRALRITVFAKDPGG